MCRFIPHPMLWLFLAIFIEIGAPLTGAPESLCDLALRAHPPYRTTT